MSESKNTASDLRLAVKLEESTSLLGRVRGAHLDTVAMIRAHIQDGLAAMRYGQYGGSIPDPTGRTAEQRDSVAETHLAAYESAIGRLWKALDELDRLRRLYASANNDIRNRLDPTDFCKTHWDLRLYEGHRRVRGDMCKICSDFYDENHRAPTPTEADHYHRHGRWPHGLYDPKQRKAV